MSPYDLKKPSEIVPLLKGEELKDAQYNYELRKRFIFMLENPEEMQEHLFRSFNQDALMAALEQVSMEDIARFIVVLAMYYREAQS